MLPITRILSMITRRISKHLVIPLCGFATVATASEQVFLSDFDSKQGFHLLSGCQPRSEIARSGQHALWCPQGQNSIVTKHSVAEPGLLELWLKPLHTNTNYRIHILTSASMQIDSPWQQVGLIEGSSGGTDYLTHRISIDDPAKKFIRLDIDISHGALALDDISVDRILLGTALQKNEQRIINDIVQQLKQNTHYDVQAESFRTLGSNYASQMETQRQYLEYANGIYSSITFVLASSERNKMSNPMAYTTFRSILADTKRVTSPLQQQRLQSMVKPFGDLVTATLTVVSAGTFVAFAEPFKSFLASAFDRSNYENADLSRKDRKFAEQNGLKIYQQAEQFLTELERELQQMNALEQELQLMLKSVDSFRKDLDKHLRDYIRHTGLARSQENVSRVLSKEESVRTQFAAEVSERISGRALQYLATNNSTQLVQHVLKTTEQLEGITEYKERFNQITAQALTFYERFERSIAADQNPFSNAKDRAIWEQHAAKARRYIEESKEAFTKAYL